MSEEDQLLNNFANKLFDTDRDIYNSKFIKIYNELVKHFKISQANKAGSLGKNTKIKLYGDMDLTFTIDNPEMKDDKKMREFLEEKMKTSFPNDEVNLKNRSVLIEFKKNLSVDVVYLNKQEFEKEKNQIKHIKTISNNIRNIIILTKYVKYEKNLTKMKSHEIEWNAIYSSASIFEKRLRDTINKSGGGDKTKVLYDYVLACAKEK